MMQKKQRIVAEKKTEANTQTKGRRKDLNARSITMREGGGTRYEVKVNVIFSCAG